VGAGCFKIMSLQDYRSLENTSERLPEDLQQGLAVGDSLVIGHKGVAIDGHGIALHAEVASKLHIEAHLTPSSNINSLLRETAIQI